MKLALRAALVKVVVWWAETNKTWLRPVYSGASQGLDMLNKFYDRDVSAALNIRRCAVGPGPRPPELGCVWVGATRALAWHTHQKAELKWALGTLSVAFPMMSSQPGSIPTHALFRCSMRAVGFRSWYGILRRRQQAEQRRQRAYCLCSVTALLYEAISSLT
ncbi:hypothetical protein HaLaN_30977 [Haematococcus lacustris]|uniref:Uncharacterized protein n=1 Tax=Haematococcus lacustris TaxID=44745 RepID=A0A6A0AJ35_HAELA|nr:hypothetical protein HaLaN_30977 [Haematococcus lacustris]